MAVSFRLPDGTATDLLGQTAPRFPVRTPEAFLRLVESAGNPLKLPLFLARHPDAIPSIIANARARSIVPPYSYAEASYYPIHAYTVLCTGSLGGPRFGASACTLLRRGSLLGDPDGHL